MAGHVLSASWLLPPWDRPRAMTKRNLKGVPEAKEIPVVGDLVWVYHGPDVKPPPLPCICAYVVVQDQPDVWDGCTWFLLRRRAHMVVYKVLAVFSPPGAILGSINIVRPALPPHPSCELYEDMQPFLVQMGTGDHEKIVDARHRLHRITWRTDADMQRFFLSHPAESPPAAWCESEWQVRAAAACHKMY